MNTLKRKYVYIYRLVRVHCRCCDFRLSVRARELFKFDVSIGQTGCLLRCIDVMVYACIWNTIFGEKSIVSIKMTGCVIFLSYFFSWVLYFFFFFVFLFVVHTYIDTSEASSIHIHIYTYSIEMVVFFVHGSAIHDSQAMHVQSLMHIAYSCRAAYLF